MKPFIGGAYQKGDTFITGEPHEHDFLEKLSWEQKPTQAVLNAVAAWEKRKYSKLPIFTLWEHLKIWWTGRYPEFSKGAREQNGNGSPVLNKKWKKF